MVCSCSLYQRILPKKEPEVRIITKAVEKVIVQPIMPRAIDLKEPHWYVVSSKNIDEFLVKVEKEQGQLVFFAMSVPDYELMAYNMQELKRYINEMQEIIVYYRKVTQKNGEKDEN
jgi:flavin-dependent dehydrogenase|tara:strand:+ start:320 stop:667 length:348 start_codon:yes stop_codon:yes gene_type:complete